MAVRTTRFAGPAMVPGDAAEVVFTAPAGHTALVKVFRVVNVSDGDHQVWLWLAGITTSHALLWGAPVGEGRVFADAAGFVMNEGEELWALADAPAVLVYTLHGALLRNTP